MQNKSDQGTRLVGNPHGDDFTIPGPISTMANGPRVHINSTGSSNNHGHPAGGNGVGAGTGTPDGHHQNVPGHDTSEDDSGAAPTPGNPQRDDTSGSGAKMG